ncbi:MAG: plasmid recombination protein [Prevotella sp.]|nr:plasmid recombination protein [Prevotella sp.]
MGLRNIRFMATTGKQVMDFRPSKGISSGVSNEELRNWTERGWEEASKVGNYDRSRDHLNFEIQKGGIVTPIDKSHSLPNRMAENLAARGIKDPNDGLEEPKYRTIASFIFGGSPERMREMAFGNQKVDFENPGGNGHIKRMPEIEQWARDIYGFVADNWGEENIVSFIVHLDEKNPHIHCALLPIDQNNRFAYKNIFCGKSKYEYKQNMIRLHDKLALVNEKWGLVRGTSIVESGAKHRSTEDYRRWLAGECDSLEKQKANAERALQDLNAELALAEKKHKSFTSMIEHHRKDLEELERELAPLRELQKNSQTISAEIAQKIQSLENQKATVEAKLADKIAKLKETDQLLDKLRQDKDEIERMADEMEQRANDSELSWAHNMSYHLNSVMIDTMASEFISRYPKLPDDFKLAFDGTLLEELAEEGNHVVQVALSLICGYVDDATTIAKTHGGGGGGSKSGWGRDPKDDDREWARRCLARARAMCAPANGRRRKK